MPRRAGSSAGVAIFGTNATTLESFMATRKIGRDAATGRIIPVKEAEKNKKGAVVETIKVPSPPPPPKKKK